jgi:hypothetical protein
MVLRGANRLVYCAWAAAILAWISLRCRPWPAYLQRIVILSTFFNQVPEVYLQQIQRAKRRAVRCGSSVRQLANSTWENLSLHAK